jgi:hypothetical protein
VLLPSFRSAMASSSCTSDFESRHSTRTGSFANADAIACCCAFPAHAQDLLLNIHSLRLHEDWIDMPPGNSLHGLDFS